MIRTPFPPTPDERRADVGVIGGSGLYELLDDAETVPVETPYGPPSGPVTLGFIGGRRVAFVARHGPGPELAPHQVPYRANLWALASLGVGSVLAPCASGSLVAEVEPGSFVICDQLVDRTSGRVDTFHEGPGVQHLPFADPYDADLRRRAVRACEAEGIAVHDGGTVVVINGPRFSTRAESRWYRSAGWQVVNMTQHPEAPLAAELGLAYAAIALVTDYDSGVDDEPGVAPVTQEEVFAMLERNADAVRGVLARTIAGG